MNEITLRPYQQECVDIINNIEPGSYLTVMATGLGKTATFSQIERPGRMLILSHREELVHQPEKYFDCSFGIEQAEETSNGEEVISASVPSLVNRLDKFKPDDFDIIITDEAHHAVAPSYQKIYDYFNPRLHLGFTATPNRADKEYLGKIYSKIIFHKDIRWGIQNNYLCDIECHRVNIGYDLSKVHTRLGDFAVNELSEAVNITQCNEAVAEVYKQYAVGQTLIFAASVEHANNIASLIPEAEVITATTQNRTELLDAFRNNKLKCIVNCMVLTEGTDLPNIETIIMCRPTKNISLYMQCVGRGLRLYPGKEKLNLIDCVGASSMDICTAPDLFGIDSKLAAETGNNEGRLSDMEQRIAEVQNQMMFQRDFWKLNNELIDLFSDGGNKYNMHNVNFIFLPNRDLLCSLGKKRSIRISNPDALDKTNMQVMEGRTLLSSASNLTMQEALDKAYDLLITEYNKEKSIWDNASIQKWSDQAMTLKQKELILRLYKRSELLALKVDFRKMNKYQASILISRKFAN